MLPRQGRQRRLPSMIRYSPPDGFRFTAENIHKAKEFYADWLEHVGMHNGEILRDSWGHTLAYANVYHNINLPWTVIRNSLYVETPLPEGDV